MLALIAATLLSPDWVPPINPPGLLIHIGSLAFHHSGQAMPLGSSPDGKRLYTVGYAGCGFDSDLGAVSVWEVETGKLLTTYELIPPENSGRAPIGSAKWRENPRDRVSRYRFAPDGVRLLIERREGFVGESMYFLRVLDPDTGKVIREGKPWKTPPPFEPNRIPGQFNHVSSFTAKNWVEYHAEKEMVLLDAETGKVTSFTPAVPNEGGLIDVTTDGKVALAGPAEGKFRLYDLPDMKQRAEWPDEEGRKIDGFTPDGKFLRVWDKRKAGWALELWSVSGLSRQTVFSEQQAPGFASFSANGKTFAYFSDDAPFDSGEWEIRNTANGKLLMKLPFDFRAPTFSPDGRTVWARPTAKMFVPWDVTTGRPAAIASDPPGPVTRFRFVGEDRLVGLSEGFVFTWDPTTGKGFSRASAPLAIDSRFGTAFSPAGDRLVFTEKSLQLVSWNLRTGAEQKTPVRPTDRKPEDLDQQLSPDGRVHVVIDKEILIIRRPADGKVIVERPVPKTWNDRSGKGRLSTVLVSADGKLLAASRNADPESTSIVLFDLTNSNAKEVVLELGHSVSAMAFNPDARLLVCAGERRTGMEFGTERVLTVWDLTKNERVRTDVLTAWQMLSIQFAPNGKLLAVHCGDRVLFLDAATWALRARIWTGHPNSYADLPREQYGDTLSWSPSGRLLIVRCADERLAVWDVTKLTGK